MNIDYSYKPHKEDVFVGFYNHSSLPYYKELSQKMVETANRYGVQLFIDPTTQQAYDRCLVKHAIVLTDLSDPIKASLQYAPLLDWYYTMSLAISYDNPAKMLHWKETIEGLKKKYNFRINYLRPDIADNRKCITSTEKIVDNLVCDTVRIKYNSRKDETYKIYLDAPTTFYFNAISKIYMNYKLYHRSPNDGFIALRHSTGFFITATKTCKSPLDLARISYVHHYDEAKNELFYSGNYLPSSDVVEATLVFRDNPRIIGLVHTHASERYTRNPQFADKIAVERGSYGTPELGRQINSVIKDHLDDFIILEEHGEVFSLTGNPMEIPKKMELILFHYSQNRERKVVVPELV